MAPEYTDDQEEGKQICSMTHLQFFPLFQKGNDSELCIKNSYLLIHSVYLLCQLLV